MEGVPTVYKSAFRPDPLAAAVDLWALTEQMLQYFEGGARQGVFGEHQDIAVAAGQRHHSTDGVRDLRPLGQPCCAGVVDLDTGNELVRALLVRSL